MAARIEYGYAHERCASRRRVRAAPLSYKRWEDTPFFGGRERAALAWTEAVTRVGENRLPDDLYQSVQRHFSEKELVDLTLAMTAINGLESPGRKLSDGSGQLYMQ